MGSITNSLETKYNIELGILNFLLNLLQVDYVFEIFQLKDIELLKIDENHDDIAIFKCYDMMKKIRLITNVKFKLVSSKNIIANHGKHTWLIDFQLQTFNVRENNSISKELIDEYNEMLYVNRKIKMIDDLIKKQRDDVVMYQLKQIIIFSV